MRGHEPDRLSPLNNAQYGQSRRGWTVRFHRPANIHAIRIRRTSRRGAEAQRGREFGSADGHRGHRGHRERKMESGSVSESESGSMANVIRHARSQRKTSASPALDLRAKGRLGSTKSTKSTKSTGSPEAVFRRTEQARSCSLGVRTARNTLHFHRSGTAAS